MYNNYIEFEKAKIIIENILTDNDYNNFEVVPWIFVKVLRLLRKEYDFIKQVNVEQLERMKVVAKKIARGQTLSQVFGYIEFYNNFFKVTRGVFDPRLSTEALIDAVKDNVKINNKTKLLDLCTGTGCVAITFGKLFKNQVDAVDLSKRALKIARHNNDNHKTQVNFYLMDILKPWKKLMGNKYDIIVSNPPYWTSDKILKEQEIVKNNPKNAFDGGDSGVKFHKRIIEVAPEFLNKGGKLFLEVDAEQLEFLTQLLSNNFTNICTFKDHRGLIRVICATLK